MTLHAEAPTRQFGPCKSAPTPRTIGNAPPREILPFPTAATVSAKPTPTATAKPDREGRPKLEGQARRDFEGPLLDQPLSRGAKALLRLLLAEYFRGYADCWPGNPAVARMMGCGERSLRNWLPELERSGILTIVDDDTIHSRRRLILTDHPDAARLIAKLRANPSVRFERTSGINTSDRRQATRQNLPGGPGKNGRPDPAKFATESLTRFVNQKEETPEDPPNPPRGGPDGGTGNSSLPTKRPEGDPTPTPPEPAPKPVQATAEPKPDVQALLGREGLTEGQRAFLASLTPDLLERLAGATAGKQDSLLRPHAQALNPEIAGLQIRMEWPAKPAPPPPPMPVATEDLIQALPTGEAGWAQSLAEDLVHKFGSKQDRSLWGEINKACMAVWRGEVDPDAMLTAYRRAMEPDVKVRGAMWWVVYQDKAGLRESPE